MRLSGSFALPIVAVALLILAFNTLSAIFAQPPATPEKKDEDPDRTGSLSRSLSFARDREMETRLRGTSAVFATGRSVDGVRQLAEFLSLPEPHNVQVGTAFRDIREEATRQLRHGSAELREQFRRETEIRANGELREALASRDLVALAGIAARYPFTPVARESVETLAIQYHDHGNLDEVIRTAQRWIERSPDPLVAAQQSPQLVSLWIAALQELGAADLAAQLAAKYPIPAESNPFRIGTPPPVTPGLPVLPPGIEVAWDVTTELSPSAQLLLRKVLNDLSRQGVQPSLAMRPLMLADRIVWRSLTEILCVHRQSGEILWRKPIADPSMEAITQLGPKADPNLERRLRMELGHRVLRNSILGQLTTDGQRVYCVETATYPTPPPLPAAVPNAPAPVPDAYAPVPELTVVAYSLADGSVEWKSHEAWGDEHRGTFIFGAPPLQGTNLYAVVQQKDQLLLLRMDAVTGRLNGPASVLGDVPRLTLDPRRLTQACPIIWHNGLAICATGAGAVAAVDVFSGQLSWGFRHSRDDVDVAPGMLQPPVERNGWSWLTGWQSPQLARFGTQLIHASPETNRIRCLSVDEGQLLWEMPISGARSLLGGDDQRVVVAGSGFVRSLRLADGSIEREYLSSVPVVSSAWEGSTCQLALRDGRRIDWNPATWVVSSSTGGQLPSEPLLAVAGSQLRIQGASERSLMRHVSIGTAQLTVRVNGLFLQPASGDAPAIESAAVPLLKDLDGTARDPLAGQPLSADWLAAENTYRGLRRAIAAGDSPAMFRHCFRLLELHPETWEAEVLASPPVETAVLSGLESARTIRLDAMLRGVLQSQWDTGTPDQRSALLQAFQLWAALPATQQDDLARPLEQLSFLPPRFFERPFEWKTLSELAIQQLELRRRSTTASRPAAAAALWRLAELHIERGDWSDAANLIEQLQRRFGEIAIRGEETPQQVVKSLPANSLVLPRIDADRRTVWPDREPVVTSKQSYLSPEHQVPIPVRADRGTMFDHLSVTYAPSQLRFSGLGKPKSWTLPLHASTRGYRQSNPELRQGWAFGQFVVVQVGTELFCVSSLNDKGETTSSKKQNTILWPAKQTAQREKGELMDTLGNEENSLLSFERRSLSQVVGFIRPEVELFDAHGRRTAWVGPVSAGTTCFLQQGMLVCLETATGHELWRRYDMPSSVRTYGDDNVIVMTHDEQPTIDLLSPIDGRTLQSYTSDFSPEEVLKHWGRLALVATGQPAKNRPFGPPDTLAATTSAQPAAEPPAELRLRMVDLSGPTTLWDRTFPPGSAAFEIDEDWLGVLSAESQVLFLDLRTGQTIRESKVEIPRGMQQIVTAVTERTIYVSLSSAVTEKRLINASPNQTAPGWRRAFVNGPVHAFDRLTGEYQWTRQIDNRTLPLDQTRDVPLLLCVDIWKEKSDSQNRYWCLDARTGKVVLDTSIKGETPQFTVERDLEKGWVELRLGSVNHRFSYSPTKPEE